jgi:hypothetical protein
VKPCPKLSSPGTQDYKFNLIFIQQMVEGTSQLSRGLRRGSFLRSLAGIAVSNLARGMDFCLVIVVCCPVKVSATGRSLVQRSPTECCVSECDFETLTMGKLRPIRACQPLKK